MIKSLRSLSLGYSLKAQSGERSKTEEILPSCFRGPRCWVLRETCFLDQTPFQRARSFGLKPLFCSLRFSFCLQRLTAFS